MAENDFGMGYAMGMDAGGGNRSGGDGFWGGDGVWGFLILALLFGSQCHARSCGNALAE